MMFNKPSKEREVKIYYGYTIIPWINCWIIKETNEKFNTLQQAKDKIKNMR